MEWSIKNNNVEETKKIAPEQGVPKHLQAVGPPAANVLRWGERGGCAHPPTEGGLRRITTFLKMGAKVLFPNPWRGNLLWGATHSVQPIPSLEELAFVFNYLWCVVYVCVLLCVFTLIFAQYHCVLLQQSISTYLRPRLIGSLGFLTGYQDTHPTAEFTQTEGFFARGHPAPRFHTLTLHKTTENVTPRHTWKMVLGEHNAC